MADLHEKSVGQRNVVQRIAEMIPGFSGYLEKERRRDVDQMQRNFCGDKLSSQKSVIKRVLNDVISGGDIDGITPFEKIMNRIDTVALKIKNADRGYSGLFDTIKVGDDQLAKVYEFDLSLAEAVTEVANKVATLNAGAKDKALETVREISSLVDKVEEYFGQREEILRKG